MIFTELIRTLVAVFISITESGELKNFQIFLRGIDLAGKIALFNIKPKHFSCRQDFGQVHLPSRLVIIQQALWPNRVNPVMEFSAAFKPKYCIHFIYAGVCKLVSASFLSEAAEASWYYFFENRWKKPKYQNLLKPLGTINQKNPLVLLSLRANPKHKFQCETPCINSKHTQKPDFLISNAR